MNNNIYYVYEWYNVNNNEVFYVGKGKKNRYKETKSRNNYFINYYNKYKAHCKVRKVVENISEQEAFGIERILIYEYKEEGMAKCNLTEGGEGSTFNWKNEDLKRLYYLVRRLGNVDSFGLKSWEHNAILDILPNYNIKVCSDVFSLAEKDISIILQDYDEVVEEERENILANRLFYKTMLDSGYDSIDDFWETNC